ncbi:MAG: type II toxin-antitoxin system HicB family antitoxin [Nanoarchaeota archaeon]
MNYRGIELDVVIVPEGKGKNIIYSINAIQVPNVVTQGRTIEEAKRRLREALNLYFEDMITEKKILVQSIKEDGNTPLISRILL